MMMSTGDDADQGDRTSFAGSARGQLERPRRRRQTSTAARPARLLWRRSSHGPFWLLSCVAAASNLTKKRLERAPGGGPNKTSQQIAKPFEQHPARLRRSFACVLGTSSRPRQLKLGYRMTKRKLWRRYCSATQAEHTSLKCSSLASCAMRCGNDAK